METVTASTQQLSQDRDRDSESWGHGVTPLAVMTGFTCRNGTAAVETLELLRRYSQEGHGTLAEVEAMAVKTHVHSDAPPQEMHRQ